MANIPTEIQTIIDYINKRDSSWWDFWFYDFPQSFVSGSYSGSISAYPLTDYSWCVIRAANTNTINFRDSVNYHETPHVIPTAIKRIDISSSDGQGTEPYSYSDSYATSSNIILTTSSGNANYCMMFYSGSTPIYSKKNSDLTPSISLTRSKSGTLAEVFEDISKWYKNIDIYVDGEEWSRVSPITYTWSSVPSISGKNGILRLTQLNSTTDGNPVNNGTASDFYAQPDQANIMSLYPNVIYGTEKIVAYSGNKNELTIKWTDSTHFTMKFNIYMENGIYSISFDYTLPSASVIPKLMILIDLTGENPLMRPSMVFKNGDVYSYNIEEVADGTAHMLYTWFYDGMTIDDDPVFGESNSEAGGDGSVILTDEAVSHGGMPNHSAIDMIKLYSLSGSDIAGLMNWMNDDDVQILAKWFDGDPLQGIIGVNLSPINFESQDTGISSTVHIFGYDTEVSAFRFSTQFVPIDCGEYTFDPQMGDTYLDYNPFTKIKLYLPFIGTLELNTDDVMNRTIKLRYVFDLLYGVCVAQVLVYGDDGYSVHYERVGQFLTQLPLAKADYDQMSSALKNAISTIVGMVGSAFTGGLTSQSIPNGNVAGGVVGGLSSLAQNVITSHPNVIYNGGSPTGVSGFMGVEEPYILIETPKLARPERDAEFVGMPSFITGKISTFTDFAKFKEVHLEGFACTGNERERIMDYLRKGVIIRSGSSTPSDTPQSGGQLIIFLRNLSETNVIGKAFATSSGSTIKIVLEGKLILNQSIETPKFLVEGNVLSYNYAYIPMFDRFYYITDIVLKEQNMMEVSFDVDVLQSFKSQILNCEGIADRSTNRTNYYINDGSLTVQQNTRLITQHFTKSGAKFSFARETDCKFILTVASFK